MNLSDLREPKSHEFYKLCNVIQQQSKSNAHSIFSTEREKELFDRLANVKIVIAAWGVSDHLNELIAECMKSVSGFVRLVGVEKADCPGKYYHPLLQGTPMTQQQWLEKILKALE